jgi:hypothetical protein
LDDKGGRFTFASAFQERGRRRGIVKKSGKTGLRFGICGIKLLSSQAFRFRKAEEEEFFERFT